MKNNPPAFQHYISRIAMLEPPKRRNKHDPRYQAQWAVREIARGTPCDFSEAAWRALPWQLKFYGLRRIYVSKGLCRYIFDANEPSSGVSCALDWLLHNGWRPPRTLAVQPQGPGLKQDGVDHG